VAACDEIKVYRDLDKSGKSIAKRPEFQQFLAAIQASPPAVVAAYDQSRSFRNTTEALDFYALMERLPTVIVVFHIGHFERSPVGEFSYTTMAAAHTMERKMTGAKIKGTYQYLNAMGVATGSPPYGYVRNEDGGLEAVEDEAAVVRRIFEMYVTGTWSAQGIAARLNDEGIQRHRARSRHGWLPDTVVDTLRNVAYVGKTYSESRARRQGELIAAQWPAIVDQTLFARARELMGERKVRRSPVGRPYAFGRLLYCTECGEARRAVTDHGIAYYHCRRDVTARCPATPAREDVLVAWATALFNRLEAIQPESVSGAVDSARSSRTGRVGSVEQVEASLQRLEKLFVWGHVGESEYLTRRRRCERSSPRRPRARRSQCRSPA